MKFSLKQWIEKLNLGELGGSTQLVCSRVALAHSNRLVLADAGGQLSLTWKNGSLEANVCEVGDWVQVRVCQPRNQQNYFVQIEMNDLPEVQVLQRARKEPPVETNSARLRARQKMVTDLRQGLIRLGLEEVETPTLVPCAGIEPTLEPFSTVWRLGRRDQRYYLPTSPELHLKRLMLRGWTDIFEFKSCFRNNELSQHHQPEFLMLEWYRAFQDLDQFATDLEVLLNEYVVGEQIKIQTRSMASLFDEFLDKKLTPFTEPKELASWVRESNGPNQMTEVDELFHWLFVQHIEPRLIELGPTLINGFLPSQKALARLTADGWADRAEFYWQGLEIANAFHEETDAGVLRSQFAKDQQQRKLNFELEFDSDPEFLELTECGLPPAYGVALGVDRLFMAKEKLTDINQCRFFSMSLD